MIYEVMAEEYAKDDMEDKRAVPYYYYTTPSNSVTFTSGILENMTVEARQWQSSLDGIANLTLAKATVDPPTAKQILVRITAVSLNYKDGETVNGFFKHHKTSVAPPNLVPCSDAAGRVMAVGDKVTKWKVGDRVLSTSYPTFLTGQVQASHLATGVGGAVHGVLTEWRLFEEEGVVGTPGYLGDEEACCFQIAGTTAWMAINGFRPLGQPGGEGEALLVQGTGGVSVMGLLIGKAAGMRVIVTSSSDEKLERARGFGADYLINYRKTPEWDEEVLKITEGRGADIIFENGGALTTPLSFRCVRWGGLINSIGYVSGKVNEPDDRTNINVSALMRNFTLKGILNGPRDRFEEMLRFCEKHEVRPVVDKVFAFEDAREALNMMWEGKHFGKVVIKVSDP